MNNGNDMSEKLREWKSNTFKEITFLAIYNSHCDGNDIMMKAFPGEKACICSFNSNIFASNFSDEF